MAITATRATQHDDSALPQHVHAWGEIKHDDPPSYLMAAHGARAFAGEDRRYRACKARGCKGRVYGADVEDPDVLAHLSADTLSAAGATA